MKNVMNLIMLVLVMASCAVSGGGDASKVTAKIMTNAECGDCKERIESKLNFERGIMYAELDVPSKVLTVKFKTNSISIEQIRQIVSEIGYDADEVKANITAQSNLPACCKPGGMK